MDYEKKYKDVLEKAKGIINYYKEHNRGDEAAIEDLEEIFPELTMRKDEIMRMALVKYFDDMRKDGICANGIHPSDIIEWLKRQKRDERTTDNGMDYEQKYKNALERAKEFQKSKDGLCVLTAESIFPELKESEDERIRKALVRFHKSTIDVDGIKGEDIIAWLEKQKSVGEIVERCKNSWYNEGKIAGMAEGLTNDEKYQQGWHDALEKQGEHDETSTAIKNPEAYRIGFADGEAHAKEEMNTLSDEDKMMLNELIIGFYGYREQYPNFWKLRTDEIIEWLKKKKDERTTDN